LILLCYLNLPLYFNFENFNASHTISDQMLKLLDVRGLTISKELKVQQLSFHQFSHYRIENC